MGTEIDRTLDVVLRERSTEEAEEGDRLVSGRSGLMGLVLVIAGVAAWSWLGPAVCSFALGTGALLMRLAVTKKRAKSLFTTVTRKARVVISEEGVKVAAEPLIPRASIVQAYFQPKGDLRPSVRCLDQRGQMLFETEVENEAEAEELLAALGQDASHMRSEFRVASPHFNGPWAMGANMIITIGSLMLALWAGGAHGWAGGGPVLFALVAWLVSLNLNQRVDVGVDGVLVRWVGRERFIPFEQVKAITAKTRHVELTLHDGTAKKLWSPDSRLGLREAGLHVEALAARLQEAKRAHDQSAGARELAAFVGRGNRAVAEWKAELIRLHDPEMAGGYRTRASRGEDLWRVVEDTTAPEDARAGAAVALRKEDGAPPRLRVAAEAVASPKLRIALERAADPAVEEAALDEALEAFAEERAAT